MMSQTNITSTEKRGPGCISHQTLHVAAFLHPGGLIYTMISASSNGQ